jgi:uncharacterized protein YjiS (DUF1127 family)
MTASSITLRHTESARPQLWLRGMLDRFAAADARYRDRANLARLDTRLIRDMGVTCADVDAELRRGSIW